MATWNFFLQASMFALRFKMANLSAGAKKHAALFYFVFFAWAIFSSIYLSFQQPMLPVTNHFVAHTVWLFCCFLHILAILLHTGEHHVLSQFETDVYYCSLQGISTVYLALKCDKTFLLYCMIFRCGVACRKSSIFA